MSIIGRLSFPTTQTPPRGGFCSRSRPHLAPLRFRLAGCWVCGKAEGPSGSSTAPLSQHGSFLMQQRRSAVAKPGAKVFVVSWDYTDTNQLLCYPTLLLGCCESTRSAYLKESTLSNTLVSHPLHNWLHRQGMTRLDHRLGGQLSLSTTRPAHQLCKRNDSDTGRN